jgi:AraC family transcriptional regulator of adaptative response/methylated-DNA-[protein]-cysteine methyltransferase
MKSRNNRLASKPEEIFFSVNKCYLGYVLVAQTEKGICAIIIGDDPEEIILDLQNRFPHANFSGGDKPFEKMVKIVLKFILAPTKKFDLPVDIKGTEFQQKVWNAVKKIPPGVMVTYSEIANRIGSPKAVRAVGSACSANPLAIVIPCHRVVSMNGSLCGYRWGLNRKELLLERETGK